jgi:hypothetical protein
LGWITLWPDIPAVVQKSNPQNSCGAIFNNLAGLAALGPGGPSCAMPKHRSRRLTLGGLLLGVFGWIFWQFSPAQAVFAIAQLSDPAKLATLGERGANPRLNKIVYWLHEADGKGASPETAIRWAQRLNGVRPPKAELVRDSLARNFKIAEQLGLFSGENLDRLRRGSAGQVTKGPYRGESVEIDHIVPFSLAPEAGNELANLEMLPKSLNRQKSDRVNERQVAHARALHEAGLLDAESLERVTSRAARR